MANTVDFSPDTLAKMQTRAAQHVAVRKFNTRESLLAATIATGLGGTSPVTTQGDLIVGNVSGAEARLAIGTSGFFLKSNGTTAAWAALPTYPTKGAVLSLSAASAGTLTIPANTLQAGDYLEIRAGETTDGSSTPAAIELDLDATALITLSDSNTAAHQWSLSAALYYDGANFKTADAVARSTGSTTVASGASNAAAAGSSHTVSIKTDASAVKGAIVATLYRP